MISGTAKSSANLGYNTISFSTQTSTPVEAEHSSEGISYSLPLLITTASESTVGPDTPSATPSASSSTSISTSQSLTRLPQASQTLSTAASSTRLFEPSILSSTFMDASAIEASVVSSSVMAILTQSGIPPSIASSIEPIIVATQSASSPSASPSGGISPEEQSLIEAFIQLLTQYFNVD